MSVALVAEPSVDDVEAVLLAQILASLAKARGNRSWAELAREIGVGRTMLRMMELRGVSPGIDTLSALIHWDEPTYLPLVIQYLKHRGELLRRATRAA